MFYLMLTNLALLKVLLFVLFISYLFLLLFIIYFVVYFRFIHFFPGNPQMSPLTNIW